MRRRPTPSLDELFRRLPDDWQQWDAQRTAEFKAVMRDLQAARTLASVDEAARRAVSFYGVDPRAAGLGS